MTGTAISTVDVILTGAMILTVATMSPGTLFPNVGMRVSAGNPVSPVVSLPDCLQGERNQVSLERPLQNWRGRFFGSECSAGTAVF
jgi:hypothetical protein